MWAEVGRYVSAAGPYGLAILLAVSLLAVLGTVVIVITVSKSQIPQGDIRVRILGIKVSWGQSGGKRNDRKHSPNPAPDGDGTKEYQLRAVESDKGV